MQALANNTSSKISELVDLLGLFFQIRDDYVNLTSEEYMKSRGSFADDLTEGKYSFPIVHAILFGIQSERLKEILKLRTKDENIKKEAIQIIEESGSLEFTRAEMTKLVGQINELLSALEGNKIVEKIMQSLSW
jgi:geranylgeranyl diphosphate synthase type 3